MHTTVASEFSDYCRRIPTSQAAQIIGSRFHEEWSSSDPNALEHEYEFGAPDAEAWQRAANVQDVLARYLWGGLVSAYALTDDGSAFIRLPLHWVSDPVFKLCIRTERFRLGVDVWEPIWIDGPELSAVLPPNGRPRKKDTYEWHLIVHEAWRFTLQCESIPTNAEIVRHLADWCPANGQAYPDSSHLSKTAKTVLAFFNKNKSGRQDLDQESRIFMEESRI